eukprot:2545894-Amphidinium_carterae.1
MAQLVSRTNSETDCFKRRFHECALRICSPFLVPLPSLIDHAEACSIRDSQVVKYQRTSLCDNFRPRIHKRK